MKTTLFALVMLFAIYVQAHNENEASYVITKKDTVFCENLQMGFFNTKMTVNDQTKLVVPNSDVVAFMKNGVRFELKKSVINSRETNQQEFMQLMVQKKNFKILRSSKQVGSNAFEYYVYKDDQYLCQVTERNVETIQEFFKSI